MADTYKKLYQGQLPATTAILFTAAAGLGTIIKHIQIVSISDSELTFQLFRGGTTSPYAITPEGWTVLAKGKMEFDGTIALSAGETFAGVAQLSNSLNILICGDEVS